MTYKKKLHDHNKLTNIERFSLIIFVLIFVFMIFTLTHLIMGWFT